MHRAISTHRKPVTIIIVCLRVSASVSPHIGKAPCTAVSWYLLFGVRVGSVSILATGDSFAGFTCATSDDGGERPVGPLAMESLLFGSGEHSTEMEDRSTVLPRKPNARDTKAALGARSQFRPQVPALMSYGLG
ncbi:hypothetical protein ACER0C_030709 [Sarotherodon galilaeus]